MRRSKRLSSRRLLLLGTAVAVLAGGATITTAVRPLVVGRLPR